MENNFKEIFVKRNRFFPVVAYTTEVVGSDKYIEIAAVEQLKAENERLKAELKATDNVYKMNRLYVKNVRDENEALKSKLKIAKNALEFYASLADRLSVEYAYEDGTFAYHVVSDDRVDTLAEKVLTEIGGEI